MSTYLVNLRCLFSEHLQYQVSKTMDSDQSIQEIVNRYLSVQNLGYGGNLYNAVKSSSKLCYAAGCGARRCYGLCSDKMKLFETNLNAHIFF